MSAERSTTELIQRYLIEVAQPADIDELQRQLQADPKLADAFAEELWFDALIQTAFVRHTHTSDIEGLPSEDIESDIAAEPTVYAPRQDQPTESGLPVFGFLGSTLSGTVAAFPQSAVFSYLLAAVLVGLGLLVGAITPVSNPVPLATHEASPIQSTVGPKTEFVGRITGLVDCQWSDPNTAVPGPVAVPMGRKYALSSGLIEITYDTGAKVILQGPCTYEVDSTAGGFLSLGKLTARVAKRESLPSRFGRGAGGEGESSLHPSSFSLHPLFSVRTPTATFTDLGTEFGVQVLENGLSEVHVIQGLVEAKFVDGGAGSDRKVRVAAGEAVRLDREQLAIERVEANPTGFVRTVARPAKPLPTLMVADSFAYPDGPLDGQNGGSAGSGSFWSGSWFRGGSVIGGQVALPESHLISRLLHPALPGSATRPIYFSARFTKTGNNPTYVSCLQLAPSSDDSDPIVDDATIGLSSDRYRVILSGGARDRVVVEDFASYTPGQQVLIVGKLEFNVDGRNERLQAWINPTGVEAAEVVSPPITMDLGWSVPRCVHLRNWGGPDGTCFLTDLRIGYTWDSVVGPSNTAKSKEEPPMKQ